MRTIFKQNGPSCNKKELYVDSTSNTFQREYEIFFSICPDIKLTIN